MYWVVKAFLNSGPELKSTKEEIWSFPLEAARRLSAALFASLSRLPVRLSQPLLVLRLGGGCGFLAVPVLPGFAVPVLAGFAVPVLPGLTVPVLAGLPVPLIVARLPASSLCMLHRDYPLQNPTVRAVQVAYRPRRHPVCNYPAEVGTRGTWTSSQDSPCTRIP